MKALYFGMALGLKMNYERKFDKNDLPKNYSLELF